MDRIWHLVHADGREWTDSELGARDFEDFREVVVDRRGEVYVLDNDGWTYLDCEYGDAEVVWDG